ncbi:AMP-binding protein [Actinotalea sp. M2MS4P-6]|uniref:AMP-binding protein n=1 Tax=Actinotalea sp. M2MS4P-6 TaxID=2983762 RepID=UPI0021E3EA2B|nr:AMP-binding protein [Actinotalea sp. M2MS4P-6]MCV2394281.1 AMP-binding protein [Actinotalea sp. M2MS4P-6]
MHLLGSTVEPFLRAAAAHPERLAIVHGGVELDYATVRAEIEHLAATLHGLGVRAGDRVAYLLPNGAPLIEVYYAIQWLGAAAVPINVRSIAREVTDVVRESGARVLVHAACCAAVVDDADLDGTTVVCADEVTGGTCPTDRAAVGPVPPVVHDAAAVARIQHTGGSTGRPKGVERTHAADLVEVEGILASNGLADDASKVVLIQCPMDHHGGHSWFTMAFAAGATVVVCTSFDAAAILAEIERHRVSYMILLPPTTYTRLMAHPDVATRDLSSVRLVQSSAGGTSRQMIRDVHRWFPNARLNYGWGQTESGLGTTLVLTAEMASRDVPRAASIGRPMPFLELRVVDEDGREVPDGVVGEGAVRSLATMRGYHGRPDLTEQALTPDRWLRTGDMMVKDAEGYVYLRSRKRDMIKSGGENVFVGEVEAAVREHPAVADCLVYGVPDSCFGEAVAVAVELRAGASLTLDELQEFCKERLASFKKPRSMELLDALGRDDAGKVDKAAVVRRCRAAAAVRASLVDHPDVEPLITRVVAAPEVVRIEVPNPPGLEPATSCYLLRGTERSLLVDPGSDTPVGHGVLLRALEHLGVDADRIDVLLTHEHADHAGLAHLVGTGGRVLLGAAGAAYLHELARGEVQRAVRRRYRAEGFGPQDADEFAATVRRATPETVLEHPVLELSDGDEIDLGGVRWVVVAVPGHTPGHICLHQPQAGVLLTGDHLLFHITPPVMLTGSDGALGDHLASLRRVAALGARTVLPGHGPGGDATARAAALIEHHELRLEQTRDLVVHGLAGTGAQVAAGLPFQAGVWADRSPGLRWLTAGHALAYLDHLVHRGALRRVQTDGLHHYVDGAAADPDTKGRT